MTEKQIHADRRIRGAYSTLSTGRTTEASRAAAEIERAITEEMHEAVRRLAELSEAARTARELAHRMSRGGRDEATELETCRWLAHICAVRHIEDAREPLTLLRDAIILAY